MLPIMTKSGAKLLEFGLATAVPRTTVVESAANSGSKATVEADSGFRRTPPREFFTWWAVACPFRPSCESSRTAPEAIRSAFPSRRGEACFALGRPRSAPTTSQF